VVVEAPPLAADEQQVLEIARRDGQVTPKTLMAAVAISKATATRRLADLVRAGYLQPQGKGRATAYVLAKDPKRKGESPTAADASSPPSSVERVLREQSGWLREHFGIEALGLVPGATPSPYLLARFTRPLDIESFARLEHWLSEAAQRRVDVLPHACFRADPSGWRVVWLVGRAPSTHTP